MIFRSENFDFANTIDLVKITISPIKLYAEAKIADKVLNACSRKQKVQSDAAVFI